MEEDVLHTITGLLVKYVEQGGQVVVDTVPDEDGNPDLSITFIGVSPDYPGLSPEFLQFYLDQKAEWACLDCGRDVLELDEYYMFTDEIWDQVNPSREGMLCIACLEARLGRELAPEDFIE
jgi:hypothetical protein